MRRILPLFILILLSMVLVFTSCDSSTKDDNKGDEIQPSEGLQYTLSYDGTYYIVAGIGSCKDVDIVIPGEYNNLPVITIGSWAFVNCTSLTSVVIPDSITEIENNAFYGCTSLKYNEHDNAYYLGNEDNPYLVLVKAQSKEIASCEINPNTKVIGNAAFNECNSLASVNIPNSVTFIGNAAFSSCSSLKSVIIPDSVTSIRDDAFSDCDSLTNVVIPKGVTTISDGTFSGCTSLESITISDSVTSIEHGAFWNCSSLTSIIIPNSVTKIESESFVLCTALTIYCESKKMPTGWDACWNDADEVTSSFDCPVVWDCNNNNVADDGCIYTVIDGVRYSIKDNEAVVATQPTNIKEANISKSINYKGKEYLVIAIEDYAFSSCSLLTSIVIPNSVTTIGNSAFDGCTSLTVYCEAESKPSGWEGSWVNTSSVYWYRKNEPSIDGNYWHYGDNNEIVIW